MKFKREMTIILGYQELGRLLAKEDFPQIAQVLNSLGEEMLKIHTTPNLSSHLIGDNLNHFGQWLVATMGKELRDENA